MCRFDETKIGRGGLYRLGAIMGVAMLAFAGSCRKKPAPTTRCRS